MALRPHDRFLCLCIIIVSSPGALFSLISVVQVVGSIVAYGVYIPIYVAFLRGTDFFGVHSNASAYVFSMMSLLYIFTIPLVW